MPELFACLFVFVVSVAAYVAARLSVAEPSNVDAELVRLRQQHDWLEERLQRSWEENWEQEMRGRIVDDLEEVEAQLAAATTRVGRENR